MGLLLELVVELLFDLIFNVLIGSIAPGDVGSRFSISRRTRIGLSAGVAVAAGSAAGYWWGRHLSDTQTTTPRTLYFSAVLAGWFAVAAFMRHRAGRARTTAVGARAVAEPEPEPGYFRRLVSTERLAALALLNAAVAIGVAAGFDPNVPG